MNQTESPTIQLRKLLAQQGVGEVILYESAAWTYFLPPDDPHKYVETNTKP